MILRTVPEILPPPRGAVPFPCGCRTRVSVYGGTAGRVTVMCPKCRKIALFDLARMTALQIHPVAGKLLSPEAQQAPRTISNHID